MLTLLPPFVPWQRAIICISGLVEVLFAIALVTLPNLFYAGWTIILYLIAVFPSNVYAAIKRIRFGGHSMGPRYLFVRFPLQVLLILWIYRFSFGTR
jgi:uncharacterized membrane protein